MNARTVHTDAGREARHDAARVCAVVVTYNRKELLAGCLDALLAQSYRVERILVIDNASTDGTAELLKSGDYTAASRIEHIRLPENGGGAAGFHEGFKRALVYDPDWIWAMDDDGLPDTSCLEQLLLAPSIAGQFRGPMVLSRDRTRDPDTDELAFPGVVQTPAGTAPLRAVADVQSHARDGVLVGYASVFNGVLIHREAAERIGLPNRQFFIWGDEWDYVFRARDAGIAMTTVVSALYWHPPDRTTRAKVRFLGRDYDVPHADNAFRNYLLIRNHAYLANRYRGFIAWCRHTLKYILFHRSRGGFGMAQVIGYSVEGLRGRLSGDGNFRERGPK